MSHFGFVRVAAACPELRLADCEFNADRTVELLRRAEADDVRVVVFPELGLTGYTCGDLFANARLLDAAVAALQRVAEQTLLVYHGLAVVGLPLVVDDQLFNCAAVLHAGHILGVVPKTFLPNYKEFYEARWFSPGGRALSRHVKVGDHEGVPFGADLLFAASDCPELVVGVEICEDLWVPVPPSCAQALAGATVLLNCSASPETIGKAGYRKQLVSSQSARLIAAYAYSSSGPGESSTDLVYGGHCLVAENGAVLGESERFRRGDSLLAADVDCERLRLDRLRSTTYASERRPADVPAFRTVQFLLQQTGPAPRLRRAVEAHPFVPSAGPELRARCEDIFQTQVTGLASRFRAVGRAHPSIGVSGGLDSTLSLLVLCKTLDALGLPRSTAVGFTMPGFGTTERTKSNARALMSHLRISAREVDIRATCLEQMRALEHRPFGIALDGLDVEALTAALRKVPAERRHDLVFENVQARARTSVLMNAGFVVGTGDLSELALGWCTYNADHMSMYNPNVSVPKTLVKFLVRWAAENEFEEPARSVLLDIVDTQISPELLPPDEHGRIAQVTEDVVGPYELTDFFLYHFLRFGFSPAKVLYLAGHAKFLRDYSGDELRTWLRAFLKRFFASQYKRSCLPDGPKVGSVCLSPRGDWRMPSDASVAAWLSELE